MPLFRQPRWLSWHRQPVSGRYEGGSDRGFLELRVDIDAIRPDSPVMHCVSGDFYRKRGRGPDSRVYVESWKMLEPAVTWRESDILIEGEAKRLRFDPYEVPTGKDPRVPLTPMHVKAIVGWPVKEDKPVASVELGWGRTDRKIECRWLDGYFRMVDLEIDVTRSTRRRPVMPRYSPLPRERPPELPRGAVTLREAYARAGILLRVRPGRDVVDDSASGFHAWTDQELQQKMEDVFDGIEGPWPRWSVWGFLAGKYEGAPPGWNVAGVSFDTGSWFRLPGGRPSRQGFAVFRGAQSDLPADGQPRSEREAVALRNYLHTWVHELGHVFGLPDQYRPEPGKETWMCGATFQVPGFWSRFRYTFDRRELLHLRHGFRDEVIPGGLRSNDVSDLSVGSLGPVGESSSMTGAVSASGPAPVALDLKSKGTFEFLEPVLIEGRLWNRTVTTAEVDSTLDPAFGRTAVQIQQKGTSAWRVLTPPVRKYSLRGTRMLAPGGTPDGSDRFSEELFIGFAAEGFPFAAPGGYLVRAVHHPALGPPVVSPETVVVIRPATNKAGRLRDDFLRPEVGLALASGGMRSDAKPMQFLERVAEQHGDTPLGVEVGRMIAGAYVRPLYRLEKVPRRKGGALRAQDADWKRFLDLTRGASSSYEGLGDADPEAKRVNIRYSQVMRGRAKAKMVTKAEEPQQIREELENLWTQLKRRDVKDCVRAEIDEAIQGIV